MQTWVTNTGPSSVRKSRAVIVADILEHVLWSRHGHDSTSPHCAVCCISLVLTVPPPGQCSNVPALPVRERRPKRCRAPQAAELVRAQPRFMTTCTPFTFEGPLAARTGADSRLAHRGTHCQVHPPSFSRAALRDGTSSEQRLRRPSLRAWAARLAWVACRPG